LRLRSNGGHRHGSHGKGSGDQNSFHRISPHVRCIGNAFQRSVAGVVPARRSRILSGRNGSAGPSRMKTQYGRALPDRSLATAPISKCAVRGTHSISDRKVSK
jgi:hypothetical protein